MLRKIDNYLLKVCNKWFQKPITHGDPPFWVALFAKNAPAPNPKPKKEACDVQ